MKKITLFLLSLFLSVTMFAQITATWSIAEGATLTEFKEVTVTFTGVEYATTVDMYPACFYRVDGENVTLVETYCAGAGTLDRSTSGPQFTLSVDFGCYGDKITAGNYRIILAAGTVKFNKDNNNKNTEDYVLNFTIDKGGDVALPEIDAAYTVTPENNATVSEIKEVVLTFSGYNEITVAEPDLAKGTNIPVLSSYDPDFGISMPFGYMMFRQGTAPNALCLYINPEYMNGLTSVNIAGQYTIEIPAGVVTFSDGTSKAISLSYTVAPATVTETECTTVAQIKALTGENIPVKFTPSDAVITFVLTDCIIIEDATGAVKAQSYYWR